MMPHKHHHPQASVKLMQNNTLTALSRQQELYCPVKRKQALLGSNLPGIAGSEMSWNIWGMFFGSCPNSSFWPYLKKPKNMSAISGYYRRRRPLKNLKTSKIKRSCRSCQSWGSEFSNNPRNPRNPRAKTKRKEAQRVRSEV